MDIKKVEEIDMAAVVELVEKVANSDILPHFNEKGRLTFISKVLPDLKTAFDESKFYSVKAVENGKPIGFGALREGSYITHLFVDTKQQRSGIGKKLLQHLLDHSEAGHVSLNASVNAVSFYESQGFEITDSESEVNGIRFVPMCYFNK
ncbi:GNAT family N-acetyltransferase [Vibrio penaeicida]|uniref:GNAT family N-acetyltransferase n=1 Tax=Vibrio penaeicida TaxID=104609 RepID=UPI002732FD92|nr:GNAT family N-acetyltransferase [Vibrio penaeicida]MDP2572268.1 GNAT family N-acetyltransferase [Vibrio penaeicida]